MIDVNQQKLMNQKLLWFNPEIIFCGTPGGIRMSMEIDAFNGHIAWCVYEGSMHCQMFDDFNLARDYYLENGGTIK